MRLAPAIPTVFAALIGLIGLIGLTGCVEQTPGLTVTVVASTTPRASVETPLGPLVVERARLAVERVALVPCEAAVATRSWFIGVAHAHGEGSAEAFSFVVDAPIDPRADAPRVLGWLVVPAGLSFCGVAFTLASVSPVGLAGRLGGVERAWSDAPAAPPPLPITPLTLDADTRAATLTVRLDLADWVVDLPADPNAQARVIGASAVAGLRVQRGE